MSTSSFSTPPNRTKRHRPINSPVLNTSVLTENNDLEERKQRRKSKLLSNNINSPGGVAASPARGGDANRRKSQMVQPGLSKDQVQDHYSQCLKLSAENKINAKNAFGLHLIDYMKDLLHQSKTDKAGTNFVLASCTLDAGVKIYAYRVDYIHGEAYKILSSLGHAANEENQEEGPEGGEPMETEDGDSQPTQKKKRHKAASKKIEKNLKNINCEEFDMDYQKDPVFLKTTSVFDEGGTAGLLSLQLSSKSDNCDLMIHSDVYTNDMTTEVADDTPEQMIDHSFFRDICAKAPPIDTLEICPQFSSFRFSGWDKDSQDSMDTFNDSFSDNVHKFDADAPVISEASFQDGGGGDDFPDHEDIDNEASMMEQRDANSATSSTRALFNITGSDKLILSTEPSEYSYFSQEILSLWAGPLHWKVKPKSRDQTVNSTATSKRSTKKKELFRLNFDEEISVKKYFCSGRASTYFKDATLEKYVEQMTVLPENKQYDIINFFKLWVIPTMTLRKSNQTKEFQQDGDELYDYNNKHDTEGFCPNIDDDMGGGYSDDDDISMGGEAHDAQGMDLVAQPNKVNVLDINYAKAAKRIDIKRLKSTMWKMLKEDHPEEKENMNLPKPKVVEEEKEDEACAFEGSFSFKDMYETLPTKVSSNMAKNLSPPIAFVCLLYLANEKNLKLTDREDLSDISIQSGLS